VEIAQVGTQIFLVLDDKNAFAQMAQTAAATRAGPSKTSLLPMKAIGWK
jgi:hypothetical protein